jgi:hypothetical protein
MFTCVNESRQTQAFLKSFASFHKQYIHVNNEYVSSVSKYVSAAIARD